MERINTVLGEISVAEMGKTLVHEHVACGYPLCQLDPKASFLQKEEQETGLSIVVDQFIRLKEVHGIKTIIDLTPADLGRNIDFIRPVSERSGLNIIVASGFFRDEATGTSYWRRKDADYVADWMVNELTHGIGNTGVKAGVIKLATGSTMAEHDEKNLRAGARAQKETGVSIYTHTTLGKLGPEQCDVLAEEGVNLSRVVIGHSCYNSDLRYHIGLMERGAYVGFDQIGLEMTAHTGPPDEVPDKLRLATIAGLVAAGYEQQIMLSMDVCGIYLGSTSPQHFVPSQDSHRQQLRSLGVRERSFLYLFEDFVPQLIGHGVTEETTDTIFVKNPRKWLGDVAID